MTGHTILIVEDDADDLELTLRALKKAKVTNDIVTVSDGVEALEYLLGVPGKLQPQPLPALVLLDLKLPKIDGIEVLQQIRAVERTRLLPVVMLTSSSEYDDLKRSYSAGVNSYVRKPVDFAAFSETVAHLGFYWLLLNQQPSPDP
jgi:CheY-like chemotaxis protein